MRRSIAERGHGRDMSIRQRRGNWSTMAKEANRPEHAGMAIAVVNTGMFLGAGLLQPLVGSLIDAGRGDGGLAAAWDRAIWLLAGSAAAGALCTFSQRETKPR
jgi:hypothetical protein